MKKTWQEKLKDKPSFPKVLRPDEGFACYNAAHKMGAEVGADIVLVNPSEVMAIMKQVPQGRLITIVEVCRQIAKNHGAKACCSLTTGIFIMTAANAVEEASKEGKSLDIPYWRTLKADGFLNEKYPGGQEAHKRLLEREDFKVVARGKKYQVVDCEKYLMKLT
jgi:alkylated DNA nucleotide flippase Atl1